MRIKYVKIFCLQERDVFLPDSDKLESLTGDCSDGDRSSMTLKWKTFKLNFDFSKVSMMHTRNHRIIIRCILIVLFY